MDTVLDSPVDKSLHPLIDETRGHRLYIGCNRTVRDPNYKVCSFHLHFLLFQAMQSGYFDARI